MHYELVNDTTDKGKSEICAQISSIIQDDNFVVLDTETTGLDSNDEICEIAIVNSQKKVLIDTLIKPTIQISDRVARIHGITNEKVKDAPSFADVYPDICKAVEGKLICIYNSGYDMRMLSQSCAATGKAFSLQNDTYCVMLAFATWRGDWNDYYGNYRWHKLGDAARICNVTGNGFHRALDDVLYTYGIMHYLKSPNNK